MRKAIALFVLFVFPWSGCLPRAGQAEILGEAGIFPGGDAVLTSDTGSLAKDSFSPRADGMGIQRENGVTPVLDARSQSPSPPFGNAVGMTAPDFSGIPDCDNQLYSLYAFYGQKKGVLIAIMSPS